MVNAIGSQNINPVQMFNALNAFKSTGANNAAETQEISDGLDIDDNLLKNQDVEEIKQFAKIAGEETLSDEDIKYGFTYGRSVIADFSV